eukprot:4072358-Amphidinium_carterae.1
MQPKAAARNHSRYMYQKRIKLWYIEQSELGSSLTLLAQVSKAGRVPSRGKHGQKTAYHTDSA